MGRSAKKVEEHKLNGTPVKVSGVSAVAPGRPKFPSHLCPAARTEYKRACRMLEQRGHLTPGDYTALSLYAEIFARWIEAKQEIADNGLMVDVIRLDSNGVRFTVRVKNQCYDIAVKCEQQLLALVKVLGLSPVDKDKVKGARAPEPVDPMEAFLNAPVLVMPKQHEEPPPPEKE